MALPFTRPRTYVEGDPLIPDDVNELFDAVIDNKRGSSVRNFSPILGGGASCDPEASPTALALNAATIAIFPLTFDEGERISALTFSRKGNGTVDLTVVELRLTNADGNESVIAEILGGVSNLAGGAFVDSALTFSGPVTIGAGQSVSLVIVSNATGAKIGGIRATYDKP